MSFYIIQSHKGWVRRPPNPEVMRFETREEAEAYPTVKDRPFQVIEVEDDNQLHDYLMGFIRTPVLNRSGLR